MSTPNSSAPVAAPVTPAAASAPAETAPKAAPAAAAAATEAAKPADAVKQAEAAKVAAEIRRLKLKMDGQELDLPEDEVIKLAQQAGVSAKRFQEASALKKQTEAVLEFLKTNPAEALKRIIGDPKLYRELLENELTEMVKRDAESPEAKRLREAEEKLQAYAAKEREAAEAAEKKKQEDAKAAKEREEVEKTQKYAKKYDELFTNALAESGLPKNAYTVRRLAQLQQINLKKGFDLDVSSLVKLVRQDYEAEMKSWIGDRDGEQLMEMFGEDVVKRLSKAQIKKLKAANSQKFSAPAPTEQEPAARQPAMSWREFSKRKRSLG